MPLQNWRWSTASPLTPPSSPLFCKQVSGPVYRSCCHHCRLFRSRIVFIPYHHFPLNVRPVRRWGAPIASNYSELFTGNLLSQLRIRLKESSGNRWSVDMVLMMDF
ncbi:uncharacterized protein LOC120703621 isoform X1 [Panicum virgatum]|uniref:uncharacterized protein LOC120703621 isoform X1 n=1 Tax=Panicum virgatum TaxID=38727 RepID=UPI0019D604A5|nr:uncharacterized protein LOC120703621 isoform X1 [Panicum virgatum]